MRFIYVIYMFFWRKWDRWKWMRAGMPPEAWNGKKWEALKTWDSGYFDGKNVVKDNNKGEK